jgi:hypothetical protein
LVVAELVDGAGVPLGDLTLLGETKLLLGLLAGHLELLAAGADLPHGDRGTDRGTDENQEGSQALDRCRASGVLKPALSLDPLGLLGPGETTKIPADE